MVGMRVKGKKDFMVERSGMFNCGWEVNPE